MANAPTPNDLTRQQLDELDALLQKMLALPLNKADEAVTRMNSAAEAAVPQVPSGWRADRPADGTQATPHLQEAIRSMPISADRPVPPAMNPSMRMEPMPRPEPMPVQMPPQMPVQMPSQMPRQEQIPVQMPRPEPMPAPMPRPTPTPSITMPPLMAPPQPTPVTNYSPPTPTPTISTPLPPLTQAPKLSNHQAPELPVDYGFAAAAKREAQAAMPDWGTIPEGIPVSTPAPVALEKAPVATTPSPAPVPVPVPREPAAVSQEIPLALLPLYAINAVLEGVFGLFGPMGMLFTNRPVKQALGMLGCLLLVASALWTARGYGVISLPIESWLPSRLR